MGTEEEKRTKSKVRVDRQRPVRDKTIDRVAPHDLEAEMSVLGCMILAPHIANEMILTLKDDDFFDDANRKVYSAMRQLVDRGKRVDVTLLVSTLKENGDFELIGGTAYIYKLTQSVQHAAHANYYAEIVSARGTLRRLIDASTSILQEAYDESNSPNELVSKAEQKIFAIQDQRMANSTAIIGDVLREAMSRIDDRLKGKHTTAGIETHFRDLDNLTGGLHDGELVILAARPSMGKTALAMNIAEQVAMRGGVPVLFVSLEMSAIELADRLLCSSAKVNSKNLRNGSFEAQERSRLVNKAVELSKAPLYVDFAPSRTVSEIAAVARRINQKERERKTTDSRLRLIVIDYLQLITPDNSKDPRQEQVAKIARRLKQLAREFNIPVLCLSQLNRQTEEGKDHRPKLSHLRESGAIEQDADVVMFVHREEYYHRDEEAKQYAGQAELIIAKQRNGPIGTVDLIWDQHFTRFSDRAPTRYDELDTFREAIVPPGGYEMI